MRLGRAIPLQGRRRPNAYLKSGPRAGLEPTTYGLGIRSRQSGAVSLASIVVSEDVYFKLYSSTAGCCHSPRLLSGLLSTDGYIDLVSHYRTQQTGISGGDTGACLMGDLNDGTPIQGCDTIRTVP